MLKLSIEIKGKSWSDLEITIEEVLTWVAQEFTSGFQSNESSSYSFSVIGEEERDEEEESEDTHS